MDINKRLELLREKMKEHRIDAYLIPSSDAHISEYVADYWKCREWISGFTGSAGTVVVTQDMAGLWTDSRYFIQAEKQLSGSDFTLFKLKTQGTLDYPDWLLQNLSEGSKIGFDGTVLSYKQAEDLNESLAGLGVEFVFHLDLIDEIWKDRPSIPTDKVFVHEIEYAGVPVEEKLKAVLDIMEENEADAHVISSLDDIAWLYNIRGTDIEYNPVAVAYTIITKDDATLFILKEKLNEEVTAHLEKVGVKIRDYFEFWTALEELDGYVLADDSKTNFKTSMILDAKNCIIIEGTNPTTELKAIKNEVEIEGMQNAHIRDGVAMVRFWKWLEENIGKERMTEYTLGKKLRTFRAESEKFVGESFGAIVGFKANGAIVHYSAEQETAADVYTDSFLLIDSGGQYLDGTTDITRMFYLGKEATDEEKRDYTNVLKGMISLTNAKFPQGTRGAQLDILARQFIWESGKNYMHGTGHGVGCFLNVHEGPQSIRMEENPVVLTEGMIISNEPGTYIENKYGIRIENLILVAEDEETDFGQFMKFKTLTFCPIDTKAIDTSLMLPDHINWLNTYHINVFKKLSPFLDKDEKIFLRNKTMPI